VEDRVFEYCVGSGRNLALLQVAEKAGYDVSEHARPTATRSGITVYNSIDVVPRGYYTVVICHHVLEHVSSPFRTLCVLRELLANEGRLILTVPLEGHTRALIDKEQGPRSSPLLLEVHDAAESGRDRGIRIVNLSIRWAAREDVFAPIAAYSWQLFETAVWAAGVALRRAEITCVAVPTKSE
jgi:hypothetical protein